MLKDVGSKGGLESLTFKKSSSFKIYHKCYPNSFVRFVVSSSWKTRDINVKRCWIKEWIGKLNLLQFEICIFGVN